VIRTMVAPIAAAAAKGRTERESIPTANAVPPAAGGLAVWDANDTSCTTALRSSPAPRAGLRSVSGSGSRTGGVRRVPPAKVRVRSRSPHAIRSPRRLRENLHRSSREYGNDDPFSAIQAAKLSPSILVTRVGINRRQRAHVASEALRQEQVPRRPVDVGDRRVPSAWKE
jgi:hypothetical protein